MQLVSFKLSDETYGIEITKHPRDHPGGRHHAGPRTPHDVKGLIILRSWSFP